MNLNLQKLNKLQKINEFFVIFNIYAKLDSIMKGDFYYLQEKKSSPEYSSQFHEGHLLALMRLALPAADHTRT